jgi:hypothetical protein
MRHISASVSSRSAIGNSTPRRGQVCAAAQGLFLLRAPTVEHSILPVCGFNGTSFVEVADIFL